MIIGLGIFFFIIYLDFLLLSGKPAEDILTSTSLWFITRVGVCRVDPRGAIISPITHTLKEVPGKMKF